MEARVEGGVWTDLELSKALNDNREPEWSFHFTRELFNIYVNVSLRVVYPPTLGENAKFWNTVFFT
jgi:hypothetical protein